MNGLNQYNLIVFKVEKDIKYNIVETIPHHWCVKPDYYNIVSNIPNEVLLSAIICNKYITISSKCEIEYWNN